MLITGVADAKQRRDIITLYISNAFIQIDILDKNSEKIIMKIRGLLVGISLEIDENKYIDFIICCRKEKFLYAKILKILYSIMPIASILYCKKFRKDIEVIWHEINLYNMHTASKIANSKQHVLIWHADDIKISHINPKVNTRFSK